MNYYNENDPGAAAWLRELVAQKQIPGGVVDDRSILDVRPGDLVGFTQCHFFAGIGGWPYALRLAGWSDNRPVWTGSAPCQPFSAAGRQRGFADERHLWPAWHWLIRECRPERIFGEQVAGKPAMHWLDHVSTDLEGEGYACGAVVFPACGVGAPHLRQRLYWVADAGSAGLEERQEQPAREECQTAERGRNAGFWSDAEPIKCTDGKARLVEPGIYPLASGLSSRLVRLRGYGNAINAPQAAEFIRAFSCGFR